MERNTTVPPARELTNNEVVLVAGGFNLSGFEISNALDASISTNTSAFHLDNLPASTEARPMLESGQFLETATEFAVNPNDEITHDLAIMQSIAELVERAVGRCFRLENNSAD